MENCLCGNCISGCKHDLIKEVYKKVEEMDEDGNVWMTGKEFVGHQHYCDKNPDGYNAWHKAHEHEKVNDLLKVNNDNIMECYEPTETHELLSDMNSKLEELLSIVNKNK